MRLPLLLFSSIFVFATAAIAEDDCLCWTPDAQQIAAMEAKIEHRDLPLGELARYVRYYAGTISRRTATNPGGHRLIRAKLVPVGENEAPGIRIMSGKMPPLQGEGCIANADPGSGPYFDIRCANRGAWTPDKGQIAELEKLLADRRPDLAHRLSDYARHYAGVTKGDRRIVAGALMISEWDEETAGIHIASEAEFPGVYDGGCGMVTVEYDPSTKEFSSWCNGIG